MNRTPAADERNWGKAEISIPESSIHLSQNDLMTVDNESESLRLSMLWVDHSTALFLWKCFQLHSWWMGESSFLLKGLGRKCANLQIAQFSFSRKYPLSALLQLFRWLESERCFARKFFAQQQSIKIDPSRRSSPKVNVFRKGKLITAKCDKALACFCFFK